MHLDIVCVAGVCDGQVGDFAYNIYTTLAPDGKTSCALWATSPGNLNQGIPIGPCWNKHVDCASDR